MITFALEAFIISFCGQTVNGNEVMVCFIENKLFKNYIIALQEKFSHA